MADVQRTDHVIDGLRCVVRSCGPQSGREAAVFLHGNPGSSEDWIDLLERAGEFGRAVAPDMPGFGKSERPRHFDYSIDGYAVYLESILRTLGIERAHLVLHDFGGAWGLRWAADHAARVASLTLFNIGLMPDFRWHLVGRMWRTPILGELLQATTSRMSFKWALNAANPKRFPEAFLDRMYDDTDAGLKRAQLALYRATTDFKALSALAAARLTPLGLPALVIWGEGDSYASSEFAAQQSQYFRTEIHTLPGAGHWVMVDEPERAAQWVIPFLQKQWGQTSAHTADASRSH